MEVDFGISGKKYLVTGASSGIGQATAILISRCGGKVILSGRNEERLNQTLSQMEGEGHYIMPFDLINLDGIAQYVKESIAVDETKFDGFVYSAGIINPQPIRAEKVENIKQMMTVNYFSFATFLKEFCMRKVMNDNGAIVAVSSSAACGPIKGQMSYASSKSAIDTTCEVAAQELATRRIRVNTVRPHMTVSPMTGYYFNNPKKQEELENLFPLGIITSRDVANTIMFLLSNASNKITGQHMYISGGNYSGI